MRDRRKPPPRIEISLIIGDVDEIKLLGNSRNISLLGMFVETRARPHLQSITQISFVWADETFFCPVRVVRHADDGFGLEFIAPGQGLVAAIKGILHDSQDQGD